MSRLKIFVVFILLITLAVPVRDRESHGIIFIPFVWAVIATTWDMAAAAGGSVIFHAAVAGAVAYILYNHTGNSGKVALGDGTTVSPGNVTYVDLANGPNAPVVKSAPTANSIPYNMLASHVQGDPASYPQLASAVLGSPSSFTSGSVINNIAGGEATAPSGRYALTSWHQEITPQIPADIADYQGLALNHSVIGPGNYYGVSNAYITYTGGPAVFEEWFCTPTSSPLSTGSTPVSPSQYASTVNSNISSYSGDIDNLITSNPNIVQYGPWDNGLSPSSSSLNNSPATPGTGLPATAATNQQVANGKATGNANVPAGGVAVSSGQGSPVQNQVSSAGGGSVVPNVSTNYDPTVTAPDKEDIQGLWQSFISSSPLISMLTGSTMTLSGGTCQAGSASLGHWGDVSMDFCRYEATFRTIGTMLLALAHIVAVFTIFT